MSSYLFDPISTQGPPRPPDGKIANYNKSNENPYGSKIMEILLIF